MKTKPESKEPFVPSALRQVWEWKDAIYQETKHLPHAKPCMKSCGRRMKPPWRTGSLKKLPLFWLKHRRPMAQNKHELMAPKDYHARGIRTGTEPETAGRRFRGADPALCLLRGTEGALP